MVVGSTFGSVRYYRELAQNKPVSEENPNKGTWGALPDPIKHRKEAIFFTNAYPGLLLIDQNIDRELRPVELDADYIADAQRFFTAQMEYVKPRLVLFLGKLSPFVLGEETLRTIGWWNLLERPTGALGSFAALDRSGLAYVPCLGKSTQRETSVGILLHPCNRRRNLSKRSLPFAGPDSESAFLEAIFNSVGL